MTYGIDKEVSDRADAYANNPKALQKQYGQSGNILDLIALERIKRDLEVKRQEIALQMQGDPKTVAEQTLEETKGLIQKDVTDQTSKLLAQTKKAQDSRLRKLAAGKRPNAPLGIPAAAQRRGAPNQQMMAGIGSIPPRSPVNPRGTGIAANRLPNTAYGAKGGIVSFAEGDKVKKLSSEDILAQFKYTDSQGVKRGHTPKTFAALPPEVQQQMIETMNAQRAALRPDLFSRGVGVMGDVVLGGFTAPINILGSKLREYGALRQDQRAFGESTPWQLTKAIQGRAEDPNLQSLSAADLVATDLAPPQPSPTPQSPQIQPTPVAGEGAGFDEAAPNVTHQRMLADLYGGLVDRDYTQEATIGMPDTAALSADVDPLQPKTQAEVDPIRAGLLREGQQKLREDVEGIAAQDVAQAWRDKVTAGEDVFDRKGVAGEYDQMVQERRNLYDEQTAGRADSRAYDLLARAGGMGALSNIGRAAADMNEADLQRAVMQLTDVQGVQERGLDRDYSMANAIITSADATEKNVVQAIANANNVRSEILTTESDELNELARNWMTADATTLTENGRRARMRFDAIMEKHGAEVTMRGQELTAQLASENNAVRALNTLALTESQRDTNIIKVQDLIRKIHTDYATLAEAAIEKMELTSDAYKEADNKGKQTMRAEIRKEFRLISNGMAEDAKKELAEARAGKGWEVTQ